MNVEQAQTELFPGIPQNMALPDAEAELESLRDRQCHIEHDLKFRRLAPNERYNLKGELYQLRQRITFLEQAIEHL